MLGERAWSPPCAAMRGCTPGPRPASAPLPPLRGASTATPAVAWLATARERTARARPSPSRPTSLPARA
eukprot:3269156-Lingulodinium_polyedra.AAC.1